MTKKYELLCIACLLLGIISIYTVSATPFIKIDPVSDKYQGEKFNVTGTTNMSVGDKIKIDIIPSSIKLNQEEFDLAIYNAYNKLPPPQKTLPEGEFAGAIATVDVFKGDPFGLNKFSMDVDTSTFTIENYKVMAGGVDVAYFNVLKQGIPTTLPTTSVVTSALTTPAQTIQAPTTLVPTTTKVPTQSGFNGLTGLASISLAFIFIIYKYRIK